MEGQTDSHTLLRGPSGPGRVAELGTLPATQISGSAFPEGWAPWDGKLQWGFSTSRPGLLQALSSDSPLRSSSPHLPWLPPSGADELETNTHTFQKVFKDTDSQNRIQQRSSSPGCSVVWEDGDAGSPTRAQVTGTPRAQPPDSSRLHPAPTPEPQTPRKERLSDLSLPGSHGLSLLTSRTYS